MGLILCALELQGELPPSAYKQRQEKAPEALLIKVRSVDRRETNEPKWKAVVFTVQAEVQKVARTATGLVRGGTIEIRYTQRHYFEPLEGAGEVPGLIEGQICPAYLSRDGQIYTPVAGRFSFATIH
jgi:hypothetical protein